MSFNIENSTDNFTRINTSKITTGVTESVDIACGDFLALGEGIILGNAQFRGDFTTISGTTLLRNNLLLESGQIQSLNTPLGFKSINVDRGILSAETIEGDDIRSNNGYYGSINTSLTGSWFLGGASATINSNVSYSGGLLTINPSGPGVPGNGDIIRVALPLVNSNCVVNANMNSPDGTSAIGSVSANSNIGFIDLILNFSSPPLIAVPFTISFQILFLV